MNSKILALDTEKIPKLLFKYSLPAIISMTAASLYNMVDSIFIGRGVGALAISGLAITLPVMNLASAFGALVGVGASTLVSVKLGQRDYVTANQAFGNAITLNCIIGVVFTALGLIFMDSVLRFFGASDQTLPYAREYMQIIVVGNIITHVYFGMNDNLRASGYPRKAMMATLTAVGVNCLLDPLFIFVFKWGIRGAAIATVLSQAIALSVVIRHYARPDSVLHFQKGNFKLRKGMPKNIFSVGLAPFLLNVCNCCIVIIINRSFYHYGGDYAVGAYGIVNRLMFFVVMIVLGFNQGMQPLVGFNYGAKAYARVVRIFRLTLWCAVTVTTLGFLAAHLFPYKIVGLFTTHQELTELAVKGLRIATLMFPLVGAPMVIASFFQAIRKPGRAIFLSLTRQVIFLIPLLLTLPHFWGINGVWSSLPLSDCISVLVATILVTKQIKSFNKTL